MIFCIPKKDGYGEYTKLRILRNGSFHSDTTTCINEWILKSRCKMPFIPNLKKYAKLLLNKNYFALRDLADFFRQISLAPNDCNYIGYALFNMYFRDRRQPYGVASAPANCQYFADLLIWILNNHKLPLHLKNSILVHIDDFVLAANTKSDCKTLEKIFDDLLNELNVVISIKKSIHCCTKSIIYGIEWDLDKKTAAIPIDKFNELLKGIDIAIKYRVVSGAFLNKLVGKMMNYSQLNSYAKALCFNLMGYIYDNFRTEILSKTDFIVLPLSIINDLKFWRYYAINIQSVPISYILNIPSIDIYGSSDASNDGAGFLVGPYWAKYTFSDAHKSWHINQKEAHVILTLISSLKHTLTGHKVCLYIDNEPIYHAMVRKWSNKPSIMMFIYEICILMIEYKIFIHASWICSAFNSFADALSRNNMKRFWDDVDCYDLDIHSNPIQTQYFNDFKFMDDPLMLYNDEMVECQQFLNWIKLPIDERLKYPFIW